MSMLRTRNIIKGIFNSNEVAHKLTDEELINLQNHLIKMYRDIEDVCHRHGLDICMAYGNVIGVKRHNGWIPWDDDLDTHMSREDYELFLSKYADELPPQYKVSSYLSKDGSIARFAKVIDTSTTFVHVGKEKDENSGVFIDIFPVDNIGGNFFVNKIKKYWAYFLMYVAGSVMQVENNSETYKNSLFTSKEGKRNWKLRQALGRVFSFAPSKTWHRWIEKNWILKNKTGFVHVKPALSMCGSKVPYDIFFPFEKVQTSFGEACIPHNSEKYLDMIYGDWRKVPDDADKWHHYVSEFFIPDNNNSDSK